MSKEMKKLSGKIVDKGANISKDTNVSVKVNKVHSINAIKCKQEKVNDTKVDSNNAINFDKVKLTKKGTEKSFREKYDNFLWETEWYVRMYSDIIWSAIAFVIPVIITNQFHMLSLTLISVIGAFFFEFFKKGCFVMTTKGFILSMSRLIATLIIRVGIWETYIQGNMVSSKLILIYLVPFMFFIMGYIVNPIIIIPSIEESPKTWFEKFKKWCTEGWSHLEV